MLAPPAQSVVVLVETRLPSVVPRVVFDGTAPSAIRLVRNSTPIVLPALPSPVVVALPPVCEMLPSTELPEVDRTHVKPVPGFPAVH